MFKKIILGKPRMYSPAIHSDFKPGALMDAPPVPPLFPDTRQYGFPATGAGRAGIRQETSSSKKDFILSVHELPRGE